MPGPEEGTASAVEVVVEGLDAVDAPALREFTALAERLCGRRVDVSIRRRNAGPGVALRFLPRPAV